MKVAFLLDEHLSPVIAEQLRARSIEAVAVAERADLRTRADPDILESASSEGRVLVTRNIRDFIALDASWAGSGRRHGGILFVATRRFPENASLIGNLTKALAAWAESETVLDGTYAFL